MGVVYAEIELINSVDALDARRHLIGDEEVRWTRVKVRISTSVFSIAINEIVQAQLELGFLEKRSVQLVDGKVVECDVVGPVEVRFANRRATCDAYVLPGDIDPVLGSIPMLEMGVVVDPEKQVLVVNPAPPNYGAIRMK